MPTTENKDILLGQLKAHHLETSKRLDRLEINIESIEHKIDSLNKFKWQIMGVCVFISTVATIVAVMKG